MRTPDAPKTRQRLRIGLTARYQPGVVPQVGSFYPWAVPLDELRTGSEYPLPFRQLVDPGVDLELVSGGIPPLRTAYVSDFHAGPTTDASVLEAACAELRTAAADLLLLGGDLVTGCPTEMEW